MSSLFLLRVLKRRSRPQVASRSTRINSVCDLFRRDDIFKFRLVSNAHNITVSTGRNASRFHGTVLPSLCCDTVASCSWSVIPAPVLTGKGENPQAVVWHTSREIWLRRSAVERRATFCQASGIVNSKHSHTGLNSCIIKKSSIF